MDKEYAFCLIFKFLGNWWERGKTFLVWRNFPQRRNFPYVGGARVCVLQM